MTPTRELTRSQSSEIKYIGLTLQADRSKNQNKIRCFPPFLLAPDLIWLVRSTKIIIFLWKKKSINHNWISCVDSKLKQDDEPGRTK